MKKVYTSKSFLKMAGGGCIFLILPPCMVQCPPPLNTLLFVITKIVDKLLHLESYISDGRQVQCRIGP